MTRNSTDYYRENRDKRAVVHRCPHCDYETANAKIQLTNHINARHISEDKRPFQCTQEDCSRGFAQKAHLMNHLRRVHKIKDASLGRKHSTILYIISIAESVPRSAKTRARRDYYIENPTIKARDMKNHLHEYLDGVFLRNHDIHYDKKKGFIELSKVNLKEGIRLTKKSRITIKCN